MPVKKSSVEKIIFFLIILLVLPLALSVTGVKFQKIAAEPPAETLEPVELISNLKEVFETGTKGIYPIDPIYFGSYVVQPVGNDLYVGISAGLPAEKDGALLAKYSNNILTPILNVNGSNVFLEQGMHNISYDGTKMYIPGTDPIEDWTKGNLYTYIPGQDIIKHRKMENVLHGLSTLIEDNTIYVGTGAHTGDNKTWEGRLYKSTDGGENWAYSIFSNYRLWHLVRFKGDMYGSGLGVDANGWQYVIFKKSVDNGQTWQEIGTFKPYYRTRLIEFNGLLVNKWYGSSEYLWKYDGINDPEKMQLPRGYFAFGDYALNAMTTDSHGYFYMLAKRSVDGGGYSNGVDNIILRTNDLQNWQLVADLRVEPFSLAYWPATDQLIVGTNGDNAKLWKIQLNSNLVLPPITPIPTATLAPTPTPTLAPTPTQFPTVISKDGKIELSSFGGIHIVNPDGSNQQTFISGREITPFSPRDAGWSLDGREMAFVAYRFDSNQFKSYYKLMSKSYPDGIFKEWLPEQPAGVTISSPHFSSDRNELYFSMSPVSDASGNTQKGIYKVSRSNPNPVAIVSPPVQGSYLLRDISADGKKLMYYYTGNGNSDQNEDIFIAGIDGSHPIDITNTPGIQELYPSFSPDDSKIIYRKYNNGTYDLYTMNADGANNKILIESADYDEGTACYSPDGTKIVYGFSTKAAPYQYGLFIVNADGSEKTKVMDLTNNLWLNMHCWAPDPLYLSVFSCVSCPAEFPAKEKGNSNCDLKINALDFALWKKVYLNPASSESEKAAVDFNCQNSQTIHEVNLADFFIWSQNAF